MTYFFLLKSWERSQFLMPIFMLIFCPRWESSFWSLVSQELETTLQKFNSGVIFVALQIDECAADIHNCDANAVCKDNNLSYTCTCNSGYQGDGENCSDINECYESTHDCHENALCKNNDGGYICECNDGFIGDGKICKGKLIYPCVN